MSERLFTWLGGALFVGSLADCAYHYLNAWGRVLDSSVEAGYHGAHLDAIAVNLLLFGLFAIHHSLCARDSVKARLVRIVPEVLLRSVYVWTASGLLMLACALWRPVGGEAYHVTGWRALAHVAVQIAGVGLIAASVRVIDPLELAGIRRQRTRDLLQITGPYRWVRHPLYLGWMLAVFGAAHMTGDRLTFAAITSLYLVVAVPWEEQSIERTVGEKYRRYKQLVRWRVIPLVY